MSVFSKDKKNNLNQAPQPQEKGPVDPLSGQQTPVAPPEEPQQPPKNEKGQIVRIESLENDLVKPKDDIDDDTVVSMYMPRRRLRKLGLLLLRLDKLTWLLLGALALIILIFVIAFSQEKQGNFTINLNRLELYRKGIAIADDKDFTDPTARLSAQAIQDATNISYMSLPDNLDELDGDHNGENYVAYTYYVRNNGKIDVSYIAQLVLVNSSKGAEYAVRVAVWRNGERVIYAEPSADGSPEKDCVNFESHDIVCTFQVPDFLVGYVDKYTVVIWLEGDDPECVDKIVGGSLQFNMNIDADGEDDSSLITKFISDVKDAVTGDRPINAAGTDAPDYYLNNTITWDNRRNKD